MSKALEKIKRYKSWGMHLTPANYNPADKKKDKKPVNVRNGDGKYKWSVNVEGFEWTDEQLAEALETKRLGVYLNPKKYEAVGSVFHDAESDDKTGRVNRYFDCFPPTHTIGKKLNGSILPTHKLYYLPDGQNVKHYEYDHPKDGKKVELLCSGISVIDGKDRIILDDREPAIADPEVIKQHLQLASFLAEIEPYWPAKGRRDNAHLRLAGALAKQTDLPLELKKKFIKKFLTITNDSDEVDNRLNKLKAQEEAVKESPDNVFGIDALATYLNGNFPAFDKINNTREDKTEDVKKEYPLVDGHTFTANVYPPTRFIMEPIFSERSSNQIYGGYGSGKTIYGQAAAMSMSSGHDFVGFKSRKKIPTLYVEGELPANDFRQRRDSILQNYHENKKEFNFDWTFTLTRDDLEQAGFKYGFDPIAVSRNLSDPEAKDYGRRGRELIANLIRRIEQKTGHKPFFFLDNITALADIDENRAPDWKPLIAWLIQEKNKGFPNCFVHHSNKQTAKGGSSGSNAKERLLDTSMAFEKLDEKHRFQMIGNKNVQCSVSFDKSRNFGGSGWDKTFILTMTEEGLWTKYPMLDQNDFTIIEGHKKGLSPKDMKEEFELKIATTTIYKRLKKLKDDGIIKSFVKEKSINL